MKLFNRKPNVQPAPIQARPALVATKPEIRLSLEQIKAQLKVMPPAQLESALIMALNRATKDRMPLTIQAFSALHREAVYVRDGQINGQTVYVDITRNAWAFVNKRLQVANMPIPGVSLPALPAPDRVYAPEPYAFVPERSLPVGHPAWQPPMRTPKAATKKQVTFDLPDMPDPVMVNGKPLKGILKNNGR